MKAEALFYVGQIEAVLTQILKIQKYFPEQILYLQPHAIEHAIAKLKENPPSVDKPMQLLISTTDDLNTISYNAEIVGWDDRRKCSENKLKVLNRMLKKLQPGEEEGRGDKWGINILHIRRLCEVEPIKATKLISTNDGNHLSGNRTTPGNWVYVRPIKVSPK